MSHSITVIDDAIPEPLLSRVAEAALRCRFDYGWRSHPELGFGHWHAAVADAGLENTVDLTDQLMSSARRLQQDGVFDLWAHFTATLLSGHDLLRCYFNAHTYGIEGYPHRDTLRPGEVTTIVYINPEWNKEWAGETVFFDTDDDVVKAVLPRYGRLITFSSDIEHCARSVSRTCPVLRVTLAFKSRPHDAT